MDGESLNAILHLFIIGSDVSSPGKLNYFLFEPRLGCYLLQVRGDIARALILNYLLCLMTVFLNYSLISVVDRELEVRQSRRMDTIGLGLIFQQQCLGLGIRPGVMDGAISISTIQVSK
ncbi:hypothetical protein GLYMA_16G100932v4 [Glycine max]|nr:hypothetical protein GLYMA_16G100932v4 [Glycine max]KAH1150787.1 hypothetical protein GYH30_044688 [Glycine max]